MLTDLERMMCLILSLGDALLKKQDILSWPSDKKLEFVAKYLLKNGVILPPVTVGQTVYYIVGGYYRSPECCKVSDPCKVVEISYKQQTRNTKTGTELRLLAGFITDNGTRYSFDGIGKTVFLTREDAEAALERRRKEVKNE